MSLECRYRGRGSRRCRFRPNLGMLHIEQEDLLTNSSIDLNSDALVFELQNADYRLLWMPDSAQSLTDVRLLIKDIDQSLNLSVSLSIYIIRN